VSSSIIAYAPTCKGADPAEGCDDADYILAQRSVDYARDHGVTIVAALGNDNLDLADQERLKAAFGTTSEVVEAPGGLKGVIGVSATGYANAKSFYSNYGLGLVDVAAPGGDTVFQPVPKRFRFPGALVGAWSSTAPPPSRFATDCVGSVCAPYAWMQGTSMAAPNAAGVAALIVSRFGRLSPSRVEQVLEGTANAQSCPNPPTVTYPGFEDVFPYIDATCQGTRRANGFFGAGIVDAVAALTGNR
jgi:lantibiotic leader peptide-processing serine protease